MNTDRRDTSCHSVLSLLVSQVLLFFCHDISPQTVHHNINTCIGTCKNILAVMRYVIVVVDVSESALGVVTTLYGRLIVEPLLRLYAGVGAVSGTLVFVSDELLTVTVLTVLGPPMLVHQRRRIVS
ncbi:MAG: hypothetical protein IPP74_15260 [Alphaproteobacteria bacterium]|nr:hypothetical protein [Alphaproteobacteria bacterium]